MLFPRAMKRIGRSYLKPINWLLQISLALVWGVIFFGVGNEMPRRLNDFVGAVFFIVAHWPG